MAGSRHEHVVLGGVITVIWAAARPRANRLPELKIRTAK